ncbi:MAG: 16S rRNA (guanine(527)-N(7))-methyltransferase RsmG [Acidimicrobiales bacterium]
MSPSRLAASRADLTKILNESRRLGFLGPGDVARHIDHGEAFGRAVVDGLDLEKPLVADLGAGGGIPSLPIACAFDGIQLVLIDAAGKRTAFLLWATVELGLQDRVSVVRDRAEVLGRSEAHRFRYDAVVARSFGPPSSTLECAAPLLRPGGLCVISEPPVERSWLPDGLRSLGLVAMGGPRGYAVFERSGAVDDRFPRAAREQRADPVLVDETDQRLSP